MYNVGIVACVKSNGRILREDKDLVYLPFNSEYSILLKNLETRKSLIQITIDGEDVLDNHSLILNPNSETELKGFMKGTQARNKFKFIKKTKEISDYRGDRIDDGIIRIEYWFEAYVNNCLYHYYNGGINNFHFGTNLNADSHTYTSNADNLTHTSNFCSLNNNNILSNTVQSKLTEEGITVKGSAINQNFVYGNIGNLEYPSRVIILKMIGFKEEPGKIIEKPITIQTKKICTTCGKKSKSHLKFCSRCGTFLD